MKVCSINLNLLSRKFIFQFINGLEWFILSVRKFAWKVFRNSELVEIVGVLCIKLLTHWERCFIRQNKVSEIQTRILAVERKAPKVS